MLLLIMKIRAI